MPYFVKQSTHRFYCFPVKTHYRKFLFWYNVLVQMVTDKRTGIMYRKQAARVPEAVFLLVHGLGTQSESWNCLSEFFLPYNISSYAIELRGFGETPDEKGHIGSFHTYFDDLRRLREVIALENKGKKIFLIGQSLGGIISFRVALREPDLFDGLICMAPAFVSRLKFGFSDYAGMAISLLYNPRKRFNMPFDSGMCTRDVDCRKVLDSDPREIRFATSKLLLNIFIAQIRSRSTRGGISIPLLFLLSGKDMLVDTKASRRLFRALKTEDKTVIEYPEMHHALNIALTREKVFEDILKWVKKRT